MLRMVAAKSGQSAKEYFGGGLTLDEAGQALEAIEGQWKGRGAKLLSLDGAVKQAEFFRLCDNEHPLIGGQLTQRMKANRRVGYDLNFHCPKGVSVLHAFSRDNRIVEAFQTAVAETMAEIQAESGTRVRRQGQMDDRTTCNLVWAEFLHATARPVDGVADPHIHAHCFVFNCTYDEVELAWKAVQFGGIKTDAPYYEQVFLGHLAQGMRELGYQVEPRGRYWELAGISQGLVEKFSERTAQVERAAVERGVSTAEEKAALGAKTRRTKSRGVDGEKLRREWESRLNDGDRDWIKNAKVKTRASRADRAADRDLRNAVAFAVRNVFERSAAVRERIFITEVMRASEWAATTDQIRETLQSHGVITRDLNGKRVVTTREVMEEEAALVEMAQAGRGRLAPLRQPLSSCGPLSGEQLFALNRILQTQDLVTIVEGRAGSGKTQVLKAALASIHRPMMVLTPYSRTAREVLSSEGIQNATTVAEFLVNPKVSQQARGGVVWVDEAGLLGTRDARSLLGECRSLGARLVLSGDSRQHSPVARGDVLRVLREYGGVLSAWIEQIQRQEGWLREVTEQLSQGETARAFDRLREEGCIREPPLDDVYREAASEYAKGLIRGESVIAIAPTIAESKAVTDAVRNVMLAKRRLGTSRTFEQLVSADSTQAEREQSKFYERGQVVHFHRSGLFFKAGEKWNVMGKSPGGSVVVRSGARVGMLSLNKASRWQVYKKSKISIGVGDRIVVTRNARTYSATEMFVNRFKKNRPPPKRHLTNGTVYRVKRFTRFGDIVLTNGLVVPKSFGHIDHGYCVTSQKAQGTTVDRVVICETKASGQAASAEQFYVSVSRARSIVSIFTDDIEVLREAVCRKREQVAGVDLDESRQTERAFRMEAERERQRERDTRDRDRER